MKNIFLILVLDFVFEAANATQPSRKPFIVITIDGKSYSSGDLLNVKPGQKFIVETELVGGRRDYCNFPDTYADIVGKAQIMSRGKNGISYLMNDKKYEWKLLNEKTNFSTEDFLQVHVLPNGESAEITVQQEKFPQTFLKITTIAHWQFNQNGKLSEETNQAEATIYVQLEGTSDVWFKTKNVEASGIRNDLVQEKLKSVQASCDSMEQNFYRLNFSGVQQDIRNLQNSVNALKTTIDQVKSQNQSYQVKIRFIGLPSDDPYSNIAVIASIKESWTDSEPFLKELKQKLSALPPTKTDETQSQLVGIIKEYIDWQNKLPKSTFQILPKFIPDLNIDNIRIPANLHFSAEENSVDDYAQTLKDFSTFLDQRIQLVSAEIQKINSIHSRLQAITLFDQMLRSYFSSILWAQWKSTRGF